MRGRHNGTRRDNGESKTERKREKHGRRKGMRGKGVNRKDSRNRRVMKWTKMKLWTIKMKPQTKYIHWQQKISKNVSTTFLFLFLNDVVGENKFIKARFSLLSFTLYQYQYAKNKYADIF